MSITNITQADKYIASYFINNGFLVRNIILRSGEISYAENDLVGFKFDKAYTPFTILIETKTGNPQTPFRDMTSCWFYGRYFRSNLIIYAIKSSENNQQLNDFGQNQNPRIVVADINAFGSDTLYETENYFKGMEILADVATSSSDFKNIRKLLDDFWRLREFEKVNILNSILDQIKSISISFSEKYSKAVAWIKKEIFTLYCLTILQITSRIVYISSDENIKKHIMSEWFKGEMPEARNDNATLSEFQNQTIDIVNRLIPKNAFKLLSASNNFAFGHKDRLEETDLEMVNIILERTRLSEFKGDIQEDITF